jgi:hypothetical protein
MFTWLILYLMAVVNNHSILFYSILYLFQKSTLGSTPFRYIVKILWNVNKWMNECMFLAYVPYFEKNGRRLMRSVRCLCVSPTPITDRHWFSKQLILLITSCYFMVLLVSRLCCWIVEWLMGWKWFGRKHSWAHGGTILVFAWKDWGKLRNTSVRISSVLAEIWT